ncbi:MAG: hypothetical protein LBC13_03025 [Clostridiales bacterium]|nr:hypothetical protein [Clostridiales bacterium]
MDDFLILPDDKTMENLAREYAKLKKSIPGVSAQGFATPSTPRNPPRVKSLLAKCRRLAERILTSLRLNSAAVHYSDISPAARKIIGKKESLLQQLDALSVRLDESTPESSDPPKRKYNKPLSQNPSRELLLLSSELLLFLDELYEEWDIPEIKNILQGELLCFTLLGAL